MEDTVEQEETDRVIAEAMGNIKIYVEHGKNEGFVQIKPPELTRFQLPAKDKDPADCQDLLERDIVDLTAVDRWNRNQVLHQVDLIKEEDMKYFGKTLTDALTGEQYMLVPIDVDILINPETLTAVSTEEHYDSYELLLKSEQSTDGHTIHIQQPTEKDQVPMEQEGSQYHKHEFKVPKLSLGFELILAPEVPKPKDSKMGLGLDGNTKLPSSNLHLSPHTEMKL